MASCDRQRARARIHRGLRIAGTRLSVVRIVVALVAAQRLIELAYARYNTSALLRRGAIEVGRRHYGAFVVLHGAWLLSMIAFVPPSAPANWWLLGIFAVLQAARVWVVVSLGPFWTTRVLTIPGTPLVRRGPYRFLRHPNYLVVAGEIAVLPLAFGAVAIAVAFSLLNAGLLFVRIRVENAALAGRRGLVAAIEPVTDPANARDS